MPDSQALCFKADMGFLVGSWQLASEQRSNLINDPPFQNSALSRLKVESPWTAVCFGPTQMVFRPGE
jgi:hypothetical protein